MKNKTFLLLLSGLFTLTFIITIFALSIKPSATALQTESVAVDLIAPTITAEGTIHSQNEAILHFQTAGQLTYLPFKEGDAVAQGQTIARLDTYALQRNLQLAANAYQTTKNTTDQTQENNQAGVVEGQQRAALDKSTNNSYTNTTEAQIVTDSVKRFVDNSLLTQNAAQLNVDLANYALQLATLTSPFAGVITHEDVTVPNQNITPLTSFSVADPSSLVFRANVMATDIDFVSIGSVATIKIDGQNPTYQGTVVKVYPDKTTLSSGQEVYQVDIQTTAFSQVKLGQTGSVTIQSNTSANVMLIPAWTVINHNNVWVIENGKTILKQVTVGKLHGSNREVTGGLLSGDKVIINPKEIAQQEYQLL